MEEKKNIFKEIHTSINKFRISTSKFSFCYILPFGLGILTGLTIRDSYILSYKRRLTMALASYYESTGEEIHPEILKNYPKLPSILERGKKFENLKDNKDKKI